MQRKLAKMSLGRRCSLGLAFLALVPTGCGGGNSSSVAAAPIQTACAPTAGSPTGTAASLYSILTNAKSTYGLNALIFKATVGSKAMLTTAIGNSTTGVPASTAMHFRVGMAAEEFETTTMLGLVDQKRLSLSDPVSKWFPAYPYAKRATVRMLAASSTGFGDYVYGPADPALHIPSFTDLLYQNPYREFTASELITRSQAPYQEPQYSDPGGNWEYSHTNYVMLGSILEIITGQNYGALLQDMILNKLKLHNTVYPATPEIQTPALDAFTSERGGYEDSTNWNPSWTSFSGQINSDVCDLAEWEHAFGTGRLLMAASAAEITAPTNVGLSKNTPSLYFGLGTIVNNGWLLADGNFFGWHTATAYYPPAQIALVVTETEGPDTTNTLAISQDIFRKMSRVLTPKAPITIP